MYKIIGADGLEYGPVDAAALRQWIAEGRANAESRILPDGATEWRALATFAEFADALAANPPPPPALATYSVASFPAGRTNNMAVAGLIFGLLGLPCCIAGLGSLIGLVLAAMGLMQINKRAGEQGKGVAVAGIIISILGLIFFVAFWVLAMIGFAQNMDQ